MTPEATGGDKQYPRAGGRVANRCASFLSPGLLPPLQCRNWFLAQQNDVVVTPLPSVSRGAPASPTSLL
jgi:hypothetical protein